VKTLEDGATLWTVDVPSVKMVTGTEMKGSDLIMTGIEKGPAHLVQMRVRWVRGKGHLLERTEGETKGYERIKDLDIMQAVAFLGFMVWCGLCRGFDMIRIFSDSLYILTFSRTTLDLYFLYIVYLATIAVQMLGSILIAQKSRGINITLVTITLTFHN